MVTMFNLQFECVRYKRSYDPKKITKTKIGILVMRVVRLGYDLCATVVQTNYRPALENCDDFNLQNLEQLNVVRSLLVTARILA